MKTRSFLCRSRGFAAVACGLGVGWALSTSIGWAAGAAVGGWLTLVSLSRRRED